MCFGIWTCAGLLFSTQLILINATLYHRKVDRGFALRDARQGPAFAEDERSNTYSVARLSRRIPALIEKFPLFHAKQLQSNRLRLRHAFRVKERLSRHRIAVQFKTETLDRCMLHFDFVL